MGHTHYMTTIKSNKIIYESPDGGKTVYARAAGELEKTLIKSEITEHSRWMKWRDILLTSHDNTTLKDLIEKAEITYALIQEES